jgi:hypothetical protein
MDLLAVDGHVHLQDASYAGLEGAAENLFNLSTGATAGVLMLAETRGVDRFSALRRLMAKSGSSGVVDEESISLRYRSARGWPVFVIAGRQMVTAERIEVLALGTRAMVDDGAPLASVLEWCRSNDALAVLPWGVGKWMGRRRGIVMDVLKRCDPRQVALGDNGGRPGWWNVPIFAAARARGFKILPGSDPLPLPGQAGRIGRFGFATAVSVDEDAPARSILRALQCPATTIRPCGEPVSLGGFLADQLALRVGREKRLVSA